MKKVYLRKQGFTLVEVLMVLGGVGVLVIGAMSFLFTILSNKDQAVVESRVVEQVEMMEGLMGKAVRSARGLAVSDGGRRLETEGKDECLVFRWDEAEKIVKYGRTIGSGCTVASEANLDLTSRTATIENLNFEIVNADDSSRTVVVEMTVAGYRPLWSHRQDFKLTWLNVVDEGGGG